MKGFSHALEEGMDVVMWQLNRVADGSSPEGEDFAIRATNLTVRLHRRGDLFVQTVLTFNVRGGYLSKAIGRHRGGKSKGPKRRIKILAQLETYLFGIVVFSR